MVRLIPGTRLYLPEPLLAWTLIVIGVVLIAIGTAAAMKVRSHMWGETRTFLQAAINFNRESANYWLHDYDEPDKWLLGLAMLMRVPATIGVLWALAGLNY